MNRLTAILQNTQRLQQRSAELDRKISRAAQDVQAIQSRLSTLHALSREIDEDDQAFEGSQR